MSFIIKLVIRFAPRKWLAAQLKKPEGLLGRTIVGDLLEKGNAELNEFALKQMQLQYDHSCLEIGFGPGDTIARMATICRAGFVAGIDFSAAMVERATALNQRAIAAGRVEIKQADLSAIPYENERFDLVFTANTIYFWQDPANNAREIMRVIRPGGRLIVAYRPASLMDKIPFVDDRFTKYEADDIKTLFTNAGFKYFQHLQNQEKSGFAGQLAIITK
jgi:SAM-dependent methyltransferase